MNLSLCTISFRHHLHSIKELAEWAQSNNFQGIELWGIHAKHLKDESQYNRDWLASYNLYTSMISDYLPLHLSDKELLQATRELSELGHRWGTNKLRTFAGQRASASINREERNSIVAKLKMICQELERENQFLLLETHPNTLTDTVSSTLQLLEEVDHPALRINFDVLHIWESGSDPIESLVKLKPFIMHFHFKNIISRNKLDVFSPHNVYAAAGSRDGMTPLFEGILDYEEFIKTAVSLAEVEASLEWFGGNVKEVLEKDAKKIMYLTKEINRLYVS
ncbi:sugar phosphate isomerase/epimerase [Sutcliffiella horikoshii]|uniref:sugar phosphate isomerase/epimerase family protein n=1 Tax=Sutcliffiella horikoshii TaxID=79883 RepID=UPI001CC17E1E|nr:TIM barrel protein [Sutcliffiella horikoshii]UAL49366.1 sugar phosphate isomerase/epimerase [Sutcliffiella horikoshii]